MWLPNRFLQFSTVLLLCCCQIRAEPQVGSLGDPQRVTVTGTKFFTAEAVRQAMFRDFEVLVAAHELAPLERYPAVLGKRVEDGYRSRGFPDVKVRVEHLESENRWVVAIDEGRRFTLGRVRVEGARLIEVGELIDQLTKPQPPEDAVPLALPDRKDSKVQWLDKVGKLLKLKEPIWQTGKPAAFNEAAHVQLEEQITVALTNLGFHFAKFRVQLVSDKEAGSADLLIQLTNEGVAATIRQFEIIGNNNNSRDEILKQIGLRIGQRFTLTEQRFIRHRLWLSGRFVDSKVDTTPLDDGVRVTLTVTEYAPIPRLGQTLNREQETLLKCQKWLSSFNQRDEDLVVTINYQGREIELILSPQRGFLAVLPSQDTTAAAEITHALVFSDEMLGLFFLEAGRKLVLDSIPACLSASLSLKLVDVPEWESPFRLAFGWGAHSKEENDPRPAFQLLTRFAPAYFLAMAASDKCDSTWEGQELTHSFDSKRIRIDADSGRLIEMVRSNEETGAPGERIRFVRGAFNGRMEQIRSSSESLANRFDAERPVGSFLGFLLTDETLDLVLSAIEDPRERAEYAKQLRVLHLVGKLADLGFLDPMDQFAKESFEEEEQKFSIPRPKRLAGANAFSATAVGAFALLPNADQLFPRNSWAWTLWRESGFLLAGETRYTQTQLRTLYEAADSGPVCHLATAYLLNRVGKRDLSQAFAKHGLERLVVSDWQNDVELLLSEDHVLGQCLVRAAQVIRRLDESDLALLANWLFKDHQQEFYQAVDLLREQPESSVHELLPEALMRLWDIGLRGQIEGALRDLASSQ